MELRLVWCGHWVEWKCEMSTLGISRLSKTTKRVARLELFICPEQASPEWRCPRVKSLDVSDIDWVGVTILPSWQRHRHHYQNYFCNNSDNQFYYFLIVWIPLNAKHWEILRLIYYKYCLWTNFINSLYLMICFIPSSLKFIKLFKAKNSWS